MSSIKPPNIRFSGYRLVKNNRAEVFLPGHSSDDVTAEAIYPNEKVPKDIPLKQRDSYWVSQSELPLGTLYRFKVNDKEAIRATASYSDKSKPADAVVFKKNGSYWVSDSSKPAGMTVTYRIPMADNPRLRVEKCVPDQPPEPVPLVKDGNDLTFSTDDKAPEGTTYRLAHGLDYLEVVQDPQHGPFNKVAEQGMNAPQKSRVIADIFQDSILTTERLQALDRLARKQKGLPLPDPNQPHVPVLPMANHFTRHATGPDGGHEEGLTELMPNLQAAGFTGIVFKPFIGGDTITSHGYGTIDLGVLNNSFKNKATFRAFLADSLKRGIGPFADLAAINQSLNGVQMMSNMVYGYSSPYWRWLKYGDEHQAGGPSIFPSLAHNKFVFGILPTVKDKQTGQRAINYKAFDFRVINDPAAPNGQYDAKRPTFIELYDPRLERKDGSLIQPPSTVLQNGQDSVQKFRFPVSKKELEERRADGKHKSGGEKEAFLQWDHFRLDIASSDDSGAKWDGQASAAMLNPKNPEVVNHLADMVGYWSRMVMNSHVNTVTRALTQVQRAYQTDDPNTLLRAITQENAFELSANKVLPPIVNPGVETMTDDEADAILKRVKPNCDKEKIGAAFSKRLLDEIPMSVLPLPVLFKATLSYPGLQDVLQNKHRHWVVQVIDQYMFTPLSSLPVVGGAFRALKNLLFPPSFQDHLGDTLGRVFQQLSPKTQEKLRYGNMQSQLADQLGERIYLSLLTGLNLKEVSKVEHDPEALEKAFYEGMPGDILKADPHTAAKRLPGLMKERLATLQPVHVANQVEEVMRDLNPKLAALAQEVVQRREFGLNWRIDAAKDVAEMDPIYEAEPAARPEMFKEEIKFMKGFWGQLIKRMREPFPKASIIAELTDFDRLTNQNKSVADAAMKDLLDPETFTSTPNMNYMYSAMLQLVNHAPRPDEYGLTQMTPGEFMRNVQAMSEAVPASALHQYQNLTSSHDYSTTSHAMLINPDLFNMDLLKWWGLKDDFIVAVDELRTKPCFAKARQELVEKAGFTDEQELKGVLGKLVKIAGDDGLHKYLQDRLQDKNEEPSEDTKQPRNQQQQLHEAERLQNVLKFLNQHTKKENPESWRPTPHELKGQFVETLFQAVHPTIELQLDKGKQDKQMAMLQEALQQRMMEPSETKAMRGALMNAALRLNWGTTPPEVRQQAEQTLWDALDKAAAKWQRHFGYQPLDIAISHVFEEIASSQLPAGMQKSEFLEKWKTALYNEATEPVMNNLKKVFAVQNALPGNPSVYLPDLFAQGGGEWTKNTFCQDRNLIRMDKLQDAQFQRFFNDVSRIFTTRSSPDLQVLNNGSVVPITADDKNGVLPIVRDNGQQQAIVLVNVGKPHPLDWNHKAGVEPQYATIQRDIQPELRNYQPDLAELHMPEGTRYRDVHTNEVFVLNGDGKLVSANNPKGGIHLTDWCMLVRENPGTGHA